jgi:RNA polymerase sigma factor (sigma-70 family)
VEQLGDSDDALDFKSRLASISTRWSAVHDSNHFVMHYAPAIRRYLRSIIRNEQDAEDVLQDFLLSVVKSPFPNVSPERGRFRDYVKAAVRNAALAHLRRRSRTAHAPLEAAEAAPAEEHDEAEWTSQWPHLRPGHPRRSRPHRPAAHAGEDRAGAPGNRADAVCQGLPARFVTAFTRFARHSLFIW